MGHQSTSKASRYKPDCLIQRDLNLVGMGTSHPAGEWASGRTDVLNTPNDAPFCFLLSFCEGDMGGYLVLLFSQIDLEC